jgi:RNA-binding protein
MGTRYSSSGKERRQVRAALHAERPAVQVGKNGVDEALVTSAEQAIAAREAIKVKVGNACPLEPAEVAEALSVELRAEVVEVKGGTILLWRPGEDDGTR